MAGAGDRGKLKGRWGGGGLLGAGQVGEGYGQRQDAFWLEMQLRSENKGYFFGGFLSGKGHALPSPRNAGAAEAREDGES